MDRELAPCHFDVAGCSGATSEAIFHNKRHPFRVTGEITPPSNSDGIAPKPQTQSRTARLPRVQ
jgi:hypothetical protein